MWRVLGDSLVALEATGEFKLSLTFPVILGTVQVEPVPEMIPPPGFNVIMTHELSHPPRDPHKRRTAKRRSMAKRPSSKAFVAPG
jgi:hypothetical protein